MNVYIATTTNGLGNRLKNLISVLRLSHLSKSNYTELNQLFDNDFTTLDPNTEYIPLCTWRILVKDEDIEIPDNFNTKTRDFPERDICFRDVDHEYERIPYLFKNKILNIIDSFSIKSEITNIVNEFNIEMLTAFHIRTWWGTYHISNPYWANFTLERSNKYYLENFENIIRSTKDKIFVATDDFKLKQSLLNKYNNIITYTRNPQFTDIQNDFIEMLLLSKCHTLYGTRFSTYTEMSWWFSKCKQNIILS